MSHTYAMVESGLVTNVILWDGPNATPTQDAIGVEVSAWAPPEGVDMVLVTVETGQPHIGGAWANGVFAVPPSSEPPTPSSLVPISVTKRQGRLALLNAGKLGLVTEAIAQLPSPQREAAEIEWNDATNYERASPFVVMLGEKIGLDAAALDALFIEAASL